MYDFFLFLVKKTEWGKVKKLDLGQLVSGRTEILT